jgi:glyoxalase-like protein
MELDHVLIATTDLAHAAREFESRWGLASVEGGRHPAWGTANRIVPLDTHYLELIAVVDPETAATQAHGRWVEAHATPSGRPFAWAVRTDRVEEVAARLDLAVSDGSRVTPLGAVLRWRSAGIDRAIAEPSLPFFIQWAADAALPGTSPVSHPVGGAAVSELRLEGDPERVGGWLGTGGRDLPVVVRQGPGAVAAVVLRTDAGEIVLGEPDQG